MRSAPDIPSGSERRPIDTPAPVRRGRTGKCHVTSVDEHGIWGVMQPSGYSYP